MAAIDLTQAEADELMSVDKHRISDEAVPYPVPGQNITIELRSTDNREEFLLDVWRSDKNPRRARFQIRARRVIILARIDLGGPPHSNHEDEPDIPARTFICIGKRGTIGQCLFHPQTLPLWTTIIGLWRNSWFTVT